MTLDDVSKVVERLKTLNDEEIELLVKLAKDEGMTRNPDELRQTLKEISKP